MIKVEQLTKEFSLSKKQMAEAGAQTSSLRVLDNISFECKPGRIFSLLGPNGAGKTTTLRIISTILAPSGGSVKVCGYDPSRDGSKVRSLIGFLTGTTGLYERLTPDELIAYFAKLNGIEKPVYEKRREELYTLLGMHDFAKKRIGKLSTGMKQKVSIARTMIHDPEVIVFDEPTAGLDVIAAKNIIELIRDCKNKNNTVIFSSHIMSEVDLLCDDLAIIHQGRILFNDTMELFRKEMKTDNITEEFIRVVAESN
ncbi:MAG: ATP-binding cassette domain-containing protein [Bacteroides sp.]|jgi:sodium transport system ATP-binding protein|nr:ATP-binding cassette domain-containing protein [Bacteroides sp.]